MDSGERYYRRSVTALERQDLPVQSLWRGYSLFCNVNFQIDNYIYGHNHANLFIWGTLPSYPLQLHARTEGDCHGQKLEVTAVKIFCSQAGNILIVILFNISKTNSKFWKKLREFIPLPSFLYFQLSDCQQTNLGRKI